MPIIDGTVYVFQPALPMRGVTGRFICIAPPRIISTRTPHAGSDVALRLVGGLDPISTRTPHAGSDRLRT